MTLRMMNLFDTDFGGLFGHDQRRSPYSVRPFSFFPEAHEDFFSCDSLKTMMPKTDVVENAEQFTIQADLPGIKKEDIKIKLEDDILYISGTRKEEIVEEIEKMKEKEKEKEKEEEGENEGDMEGLKSEMMKREEKPMYFKKVERRFGSYSRQFKLPETIDQSSIRASYNDGVLQIDLKKKEKIGPSPMEIEIQ